MKISALKLIHICLIVFAVYFIYSFGLKGQFQFDDYPNIVKNERLHIKSLSLANIISATFSGDSGSLKRPVSMFSFAINHYFFALNPFAYKLTNVIIHIFNTLAIYFLSIFLLKIRFDSKNACQLAFFVALAWGCHPINLTSVLYIVQRMTSLSAFFAILGMLAYLASRNYLIKGKKKTAITGLIITLLSGVTSLLSKENGALLFVYLFLIEYILLQNYLPQKKDRLIINIFFTLTLALPAIFIISYSLIHPEWFTKSFGSATSFTLFERVLTELRIVWLYIFWILLPNNQSLGLFHDDIVLSTSLLAPATTLLAGLGHMAFICLLIYLWLKKKVPYFVFGCSLFYASHLMESTILPLQLAHEHRNYLGSFGLLLAIFSLSKEKNKIFVYGISLYIIFLCLLTTQRSINWADGIKNALIEVEHHPYSYAAHYEAGRQYSSIKDNKNSNDYKAKSLQYFYKAAELNKYRADAIFAIIITQARDQKEISEKLLTELTRRLSTGPVYASSPSWLDTLIKCHVKKDCLISNTTLSHIIQAAVNNPNLSQNHFTGSYILMIASGFVIRSGNYDNALYLALSAVQLTPSKVIFIRHVIDLAIENGDFNTAQHWIMQFEKLPQAKLFTQEINNLKSQLAEI